MTTLTPEDRARLRDLASQATSGPWEAAPTVAWGQAYVELTMQPVAESWDSAPAHACCEPLNADDAEFIAATRTAVPALLDALDAAEARADRAEAAVQRVREMHVPQPHGPGQCDPDGCPDLCQECGERMPCTTRRIICERTTLGAGDWEADPAQVARYYSDKRSQRVIRALDGER